MRRYIYGLALILMVLPVCAAKKKTLPAVSTTDLRTERLVNPMSIDTPHPRLGWRIESSEKDVMRRGLPPGVLYHTFRTPPSAER